MSVVIDDRLNKCNIDIKAEIRPTEGLVWLQLFYSKKAETHLLKDYDQLIMETGMVLFDCYENLQPN